MCKDLVEVAKLQRRSDSMGWSSARSLDYANWHRSRACFEMLRRMPPTTRKDDHLAFATALDHAWRWYELRHGQAVQVINFFMLSAAVMAAGYVSTLGARLYVAAGALGLLGMFASAIAYFVARRIRQTGRLAEAPLATLQDRLAVELKIDTLRMVNAHRSSQIPGLRAVHLTAFGTCVSGLASLAAMLYAWVGH